VSIGGKNLAGSTFEDVPMEYDSDLRLTDDEISRALSREHSANKYPPILTMQQAAALAQIPLGTLRDWRSRGLRSGCSMRRGREVRVWRDRFIKFLFGEDQRASKKSQKRKV
jgi:hypothetical protein